MTDEIDETNVIQNNSQVIDSQLISLSYETKENVIICSSQQINKQCEINKE